MMWAAMAVALAVMVRPPQVEGARSDTYRVHGRSVAEVVTGMDARSTYLDAAGRRWHGGARYALRWRWVESRPGICRAAPLKVSVDVVLPRVRTSKALAPTVSRYLEALATHEAGHVALVRVEAEALGRQLDALPEGSCARLGAEVTRQGQEALTRLADAQAAYDASTGHGASQGARLR